MVEDSEEPPLKLAPLACDECGALQPLADDVQITCRHCGDTMTVPPDYVELRSYSRRAKKIRRSAEDAYRATLAAALPGWAPKLWGLVGLPVSVIGTPLILWLTRHVFEWQIRTWVVFGVFGPSLVGLLLLAWLRVRARPFIYLTALGGKLRPGPPMPDTGEPTCGVCAAPLEVEPDSLSATCDYCRSDSWLEAVPEEHVAGTDAKRANLNDLMAAKSFRSDDTKIFVIVSAIVLGGFFLWLWFGL